MKTMQLTRERVFIVLNYQETKNYEIVRRNFGQIFPERISPTKKTVRKTVQKFNEHGTTLNRNKGNSGRKRTARTQENVEMVQNVIDENPRSTIRRNENGLSATTFHRILHKDLGLKAYKVQKKHQLLPNDYHRRMTFCNWLLQRHERFCDKLIMTDEAAFSMDGTVNTQNTRFWSENRPEGFVFEKSIRREKLSLWAGVCGNGCVIGSFFYEGTLTGIKCGEMLDDRILPSIREACGNMRRDIWFMQDGAPAHRGLNVRHKLHEVFGYRVLGLGFRQEWPPRSPDLTPCDFFLWGRIKNQEYSSPPATLEILRERIESEFDRLKEQPQQIRRVVRAMRKRAIRCRAWGRARRRLLKSYPNAQPLFIEAFLFNFYHFPYYCLFLFTQESEEMFE